MTKPAQQAKSIRRGRPNEGAPEATVINNGQLDVGPVALVQEHGTGETTTVLRVLNAWPIDKMFRNGTISDDQYKAGCGFRDDYERAGLSERYARWSPDKFGGGPFRDGMAGSLEARRRVRVALQGMGEAESSCLQLVVGEGHAIAEWVARQRWAGKTTNEHFAKGLLFAGLESLAITYGHRRPAAAPRPHRLNDTTPATVEAVRKRRQAGATLDELRSEFRLPLDTVIALVADLDEERRRALATARDAEIRALSASGRTIGEIAVLMCLAAADVETILANAPSACAVQPSSVSRA